MEIGKRLKLKRLEKGFNLVKLSELTNIPNGTLSKYENNINNPSLENLYYLSKILEVSINWLITGQDDFINLSDEDKMLLDKYNLLTELNKGKTQQFIDERLKEQEQQGKVNSKA